MNQEIQELLYHLRKTFVLKGHFWTLKTNDGKWVEVDEDLNELLHELDELLDAADEA